MIQFLRLIVISGSLLFATGAVAETFWKTGKITGFWSSQINYSGCLVRIDVSIGNGCPDNGYFTLDCMGLIYNNSENSSRLFAEALAAMHANKTITVRIDNTKKVNGYCAAQTLRTFM